MWVLLAVSLFGFIVFIERTLFFHRGQIRTEPFIDGIKNLVRKRRLVEALTVCQETPGPVPSVIKAALLHYGEGEDRLRRSIQSAALVELPILERRVGAIAAVARIAPLLGLLGTLIALIQGFSGLHFSANPAYPAFGQLLGAIGEALISTALGLTISLMAHVAHHFLFGRVKALVQDMEYCGFHMMAFLLKDLPEEESAEEEEGIDGQPG